MTRWLVSIVLVVVLGWGMSSVASGQEHLEPLLLDEVPGGFAQITSEAEGDGWAMTFADVDGAALALSVQPAVDSWGAVGAAAGYLAGVEEGLTDLGFERTDRRLPDGLPGVLLSNLTSPDGDAFVAVYAEGSNAIALSSFQMPETEFLDIVRAQLEHSGGGPLDIRLDEPELWAAGEQGSPPYDQAYQAGRIFGRLLVIGLVAGGVVVLVKRLGRPKADPADAPPPPPAQERAPEPV